MGRVFLQHGVGAPSNWIGWYAKVEFIVGYPIFFKGSVFEYNSTHNMSYTSPDSVDYDQKTVDGSIFT